MRLAAAPTSKRARPRALVARTLVAIVVGAGTALAAHAVPTFAEVKAAHRPSDFTLVDRRGAPLQTVRVDDSVRRLAWIPLAEMSPALRTAIVLSEDRRFWEHGGVDWQAVATSAWGNLWNTRTRGASTLTMQLAGLIDDGLARPSGGRSVGQKLGQAVTATRLEKTWKKTEILEAYLNSVPYRGEVVGIDALAQTLFAKHASGLDAQEAAIAAALVRSPNARPTEVAERACGVLVLQRLDCVGVKGLAEASLARRGGMPIGAQLAPHFARRVLDRAGAPTQASPLDARLQRFAVGQLRRQLAELAGRNVEDGAVVVLDNASGEVLAWVGSSGDLSGAAEVDGVLARRQPGSTLKPFVYELAFEQRLITPATLIDDSPAQIATGAGLYLPQNYDHAWKGFVSARTALGASLNVPAVRVGAMVGTDALHARLNALGLALPQSAGWYGASLALGSADVSLLALSNAYRALANGGRYAPVAMALATPAPDDARRRPGGDVPGRRHPRRRQRPRPHLRLVERADDARLRGGQDRHQQGHARQLVRRLHRPLHDRRLGRQRQRRGDARRQRRQRRRAGLAGDRRLPARRRAVAARRRRRPASSRSASPSTRNASRRATSCSSPAASARCSARPARCARPSATASSARATAASSPSIPTSRRPRSGSRSKASAAPGASTAGRSAAASGCAGRRGRDGTGSSSSRRRGRRCRASTSRCAAPASRRPRRAAALTASGCRAGAGLSGARTSAPSPRR